MPLYRILVETLDPKGCEQAEERHVEAATPWKAVAFLSQQWSGSAQHRNAISMSVILVTENIMRGS